METKAVLNAVPPYGHVIATEKWRNSPLIQSLKGGGVRILFEDELGVADFHLPNKSCVLYVSECDLVAGNGYKRKLVRYRNTSSHGFQELVLVEKTRLGEQYFGGVQKLVVLDLGLTLLPVGGQAEASQLIVQIGLTLTVPPPPGPWGRQREPLQEEDLVPAVGPAGPGSGAARPGGRPGQSSGPPGAVLQHPSALQRRPRPAGAHRGSGCGSAGPRLLPQPPWCWNLKVQLGVIVLGTLNEKQV
ncbi:Fanconi anemia core complex-associated protein 24 isoform X1 [Pungitius pungitius]|uniref:Fanconi anemia core complex-associated protein 24 isoform X1 n=1 Tax=Pungitius pungitius TaxID=134920 RepID=UPI002E10E2DF